MSALSFLADRPMLSQLMFDKHTSGILYLNSLSALTLHAMAVIPTTTPSIMAVFARQFLGWAYQPPAGDQTCLGYLLSQCRQPLIPTSWLNGISCTYGTLGPPPMSACVGFIVVMWCIARVSANHQAVLLSWWR